MALPAGSAVNLLPGFFPSLRCCKRGFTGTAYWVYGGLRGRHTESRITRGVDCALVVLPAGRAVDLLPSFVFRAFSPQGRALKARRLRRASPVDRAEGSEVVFARGRQRGASRLGGQRLSLSCPRARASRGAGPRRPNLKRGGGSLDPRFRGGVTRSASDWPSLTGCSATRRPARASAVAPIPASSRRTMCCRRRSRWRRRRPRSAAPGRPLG